MQKVSCNRKACECNEVAVVACVAFGSGEMKEPQKQDVTEMKDEPATPVTASSSFDMTSESESKEGVTKMDTIPASAATVTTSEPTDS